MGQMKVLASQARRGEDTFASPPGKDFPQLFLEAIGRVNGLQKEAGELGKAFEQGVQNVSLAEVMIASQKASIAFQAMVQVRNRLLRAYQDIIGMPV
jgi:flagellar hook-basal body complex protein FliE